MSYYEILGFKKEPFSNSPDPDLFYGIKEHRYVLNKLEIAIRQKRGLMLVIGDIGLGKTTIIRKLIRNFNEDDAYEFYPLLNPSYTTEFQFLEVLINMFGIDVKKRSTIYYRMAIEDFLLKKAVNEGKTIVLLIDEGQKLSSGMLELLRVFLNFETNEYKLIQVVIMAQMEIMPKIKKMRNLLDRICFHYVLTPISYEELKNVINFRLKEAGLEEGRKIFTEEALRKLYYASNGYLRRAVFYAHNCIERIIMEEKGMVDEQIVEKVVNEFELFSYQKV